MKAFITIFVPYDNAIVYLFVWCVICCFHFWNTYGIMDWSNNEYISFRWLYSLLGTLIVFGVKLLAVHISLKCTTQRERRDLRIIGFILMLMIIPLTIGLLLVICNWNKVSYENIKRT